MPHDLPLYKHIARALDALSNLRGREAVSVDDYWEDRWEMRLEEMEKQLPHGSGYDKQPVIEKDDIKPDRFVILGSFHQMDEHGGYRGWLDYKVIVAASLGQDFNLRVVGGDSHFKDMTADVFRAPLTKLFDVREFDVAENVLISEAPVLAALAKR